MSGGAKRVLVWPELFWPHVGGIEVLLGKLLPDLVERGHTIRVLTSSDTNPLPERDEYRGIRIDRLPLRDAIRSGRPEEALRLRKRVRQVIAEYQPEIVHAHGLGVGAFFQLHLRRESGAKLVLTLHNDLEIGRASTQSITTQLLGEADWVTAVSPSLLKQTSRIVPEIVGHLSMIVNGVQPPDLAPAPLTFDPPVLLGIGRLVEQKGFDIAIRAMRILKQKHPAVRLLIAGAGDRAPLEAVVAETGVSASVQFLGLVQSRDIPSLINTATMLVAPSRYEGFGLVALEAAWMGRPVVATRVIGLEDVVVESETGKLVPPEDAAALSVAIDSLLTNRDLTVAMGARGRVRAASHFSWDACVNAYDALYRECGISW